MTQSNTTSKPAAIPAGFTPVSEALPSSDEPVLVLRKSGYISCRFEILTARYMPDYRPLSPWQDISNDSITDSGSDALAWRYMPEWLQG